MLPPGGRTLAASCPSRAHGVARGSAWPRSPKKYSTRLLDGLSALKPDPRLHRCPSALSCLRRCGRASPLAGASRAALEVRRAADCVVEAVLEVGVALVLDRGAGAA